MSSEEGCLGCMASECSRDEGDGWGGICRFCKGFYCSWHDNRFTKLHLKHPLKNAWSGEADCCEYCTRKINCGELKKCRICHKVLAEDKKRKKCNTCGDLFCKECSGFLQNKWDGGVEWVDERPLINCALCHFRKGGELLLQ